MEREIILQKYKKLVDIFIRYSKEIQLRDSNFMQGIIDGYMWRVFVSQGEVYGVVSDPKNKQKPAFYTLASFETWLAKKRKEERRGFRLSFV